MDRGFELEQEHMRIVWNRMPINKQKMMKVFFFIKDEEDLLFYVFIYLFVNHLEEKKSDERF